MELVLNIQVQKFMDGDYHKKAEGNSLTMTIRTSVSARCTNQLVKCLHCIVSLFSCSILFCCQHKQMDN